MTLPIELQARRMAVRLHRGQKRRYTGEPYWRHCENVVKILKKYTDDECTIAAAYLHDVVEDTDTRLTYIKHVFGEKIAGYVWWLTDVPSEAPFNRRDRKKMDRIRLAEAPAEVQNIKLADIIDNTPSIVEHDPNFAEIYLREIYSLIIVFYKANPSLKEEALNVLRKTTRIFGLVFFERLG